MNDPWEYREQERMELDFPKFRHHFCDNCGRMIEPEELRVEFSKHSTGQLKYTTPYLVCDECIPEVLKSRTTYRTDSLTGPVKSNAKIRNVSEMVEDLRQKVLDDAEKFKRNYYRGYDAINFQGK